MTEYELTDLTGAAMSNFLTTFTIFMSIVTAYVIATFVAGGRLTKIQALIVNVCFLISSGTIGLLSVLIFRVFMRRAQALGAMSDIGGGPVVDFTWAVAALYVTLTIGSIIFMWNVRHPTSDS